MFLKPSTPTDNLPALKLSSPRTFREGKFFSVANSPSKPDSLVDIYEDKPSHRNELKKVVTTTAYSTFHFRAGSVAGQYEAPKKSMPALSPEFTPQNTHMGFFKKEEHGKKVNIWIAVWEKINKLKASLMRYQDPSETLILPTRAEVKKIIRCLELLNEYSKKHKSLSNLLSTNSGLTELMSITVRVLKAALFVSPMIMEPFEEKLIEDCNEELKTSLQDYKKDGAPYYILCLALLKELTSENRTNLKEQKHRQEVQRLQELLYQSQETIKDLTKKVQERITPLEHKNLLSEIETYKEAIDELSRDNHSLKNYVNEMSEENVTLRKQMDNEVAEVEKYVAQIRLLERSRDTTIKETEESRKQIALMKEKIKGFKDVMDKIIIKLGNIKQQVIDLRKENEELLYQNEKLGLRAARGFDALTPRPDYRKLMEEKKFDMEIYDATGRRQLVPTIKIVDELLNRIQILYEKGNQGSNKKGKMTIPKIVAAVGAKNSIIAGRRTSISLQPPKTRPSIMENYSPSPAGQKSNLAKEGTVSTFQSVVAAIKNAGPGPRTLVDTVQKTPSATNGGNEDSEIESQQSENEDNTQTENKSNQSKNNLAYLMKVSPTNDEDERIEGAFGEGTVRDADNLMDFVVSTKKAIDKFE